MITSSFSTRALPLYIGSDEVPASKPPPYMKTITAFCRSPDWGFDHTFKYKQSSLYTTSGLLMRSISSRPTVVMFEAAMTCGVGELGSDGRGGHENPYDTLAGVSEKVSICDLT